jgi:hypothetical protein
MTEIGAQFDSKLTRSKTPNEWIMGMGGTYGEAIPTIDTAGLNWPG